MSQHFIGQYEEKQQVEEALVLPSAPEAAECDDGNY